VSELTDRDLLAQDDPDDIIANRFTSSSSGRKTAGGKTWIVVAVIVGVVLGVGLASRSGGATPSEATPTPTAQATVDSMARKAELETILAADPTNVDAHLELGVILHNMGDDEDARGHWEAVLALDPNSAAAWFNIGFYYLYLDPPDYAQAAQAWHKVVDIDPTSELAQPALDHLSVLDAEAAGDGEGQ
jgi:lipoprotein NlpI